MPTSAKPRKRRALPTEAPVVDHGAGWLDRIWTKLKLSKPTVTLGAGAKRARERLADHRTTQALRLSQALGDRVTRQRLRRQAILRAKQAVTLAKASKGRRSAAVLG